MSGVGGVGGNTGPQPMALGEGEEGNPGAEGSAEIDKIIGEIIIGPAIMRMTQEMQEVMEENLNTKEYIG